MDRIFEQMTSWLKDWIVDGLMSLLTGTFDSINAQVGSVAADVATSPANFTPGVFNLMKTVSNNAIMPIAGMILTFIACYELIQLVIAHNNLANFETWIFFKWIFKTFVAVMLAEPAHHSDRRDPGDHRAGHLQFTFFLFRYAFRKRKRRACHIIYCYR